MVNSETGRLPIISACMMVKNEEKNLPRCLDSIKNFADELIIVDTGSTDRTVEIAESYNAKVYHHPWENDFSKHRNQSIGYAIGDWIFIIDADEELILRNRSPDEIKAALAQVSNGHCSLAIELNDIQNGLVSLIFNTTRLFKNGTVKYRGIVHNQPSVNSAKGAIFLPNLIIKHYGYDLTPEQKAAKSNRTKTLLKKVLEEEPNNWHVLFYLCQICTVDEDIKEANEWGEKYLVHKNELARSGVGNFNKSIYYTMAKNYMVLKNQKRCSELITEGLKEIPGDLDLGLALTEYGIWAKRPDLTSLGARQFINAYTIFKEKPALKEGRFVYNNTPESLAYCMFQLIFSQLDDAISLMGNIRKILKDTSLKYQNAMLIDMKLTLEEKGLMSIAEKMIPETYESLIEKGNLPDKSLQSLSNEFPDKFNFINKTKKGDQKNGIHIV